MKQMANYEPDLKKRQKLLDDSDVYYKKALEVQKKQNETAGSTPAGKGK
jgi:hypothetical protein